MPTASCAPRHEAYQERRKPTGAISLTFKSSFPGTDAKSASLALI